MNYAEAWAPAKVILVGEHFVVHGSYALALAIDRGCYCKALLSDELKIYSENFKVEIKEAYNIPPLLKPSFEVCKATLNYLNERNKKVHLFLNSDVNPAAGLGSSASCSVAIALAIAELFDYKLNEDEIFKLAMIGEKIAHGGNPSGIDLSIAIKGGALLFKKDQKPERVEMKGDFPLIIIYSGLERDTGKMIGKVAEFKERVPKSFEALTKASSNLSQLAAKCLEERNLELLASIMNFHHIALNWIGVSLPILNEIVEESLKAGALAAKLTGGGGGGSVIALSSKGKEGEIVKRLKAKGYEAFQIKPSLKGAYSWKVN